MLIQQEYSADLADLDNVISLTSSVISYYHRLLRPLPAAVSAFC